MTAPLGKVSPCTGQSSKLEPRFGLDVSDYLRGSFENDEVIVPADPVQTFKAGIPIFGFAVRSLRFYEIDNGTGPGDVCGNERWRVRYDGPILRCNVGIGCWGGECDGCT